MLNYIDNHEYLTLINELKQIDRQLQKEGEISQLLNKNIELIERVFNEFKALKTAIDKSIVLAVTNRAGQILYVNEKLCEISQYSREELVGQTHRIINSGYHEKSFFKEMWATILNGNVWEGNVKNRRKDGTYYWMKTSIVPFCDEDNKPYMFVALRTDITKWKENEEKLFNALKNDFNHVVSSLHNIVFKITRNEHGQFQYVFFEGKLAKQLQIQTTNVFGKSPQDIFPENIANMLEEKYEQAYKGTSVTYSYTYLDYRIITTLSPIIEGGEIVALIGSSNDMTELQKANERIKHLAFHDMLTKLPNRKKFSDDISKFISEHKRFALYLLDVNRVKFMNESLGRTSADEMINQIAVRLSRILSPSQYLYRFSDDEFLILQTDETEKHHLLNNGRRILNVFDEKISLKNKYEVYITGTIGISVYPDHGTDIEELIKNADAAISTARKFGKNAYKIYDRAMNQEIIRNMKIEASLQKAMQNDEIELYFQPKLDLKVNKINSMEALLRWHHPELGFIPPNVFIPIAEETGAIWQLDEWVLRKACEQNRIWNMSDHYNYKIAVNISASYFGQPEFVAMVKNVLLETKLDPCLLELEITETTIINSPDECLQNVKILRGMGVTVSVDDFGTGYTSLNYLRKIPFDTLKIDQSYVRQMLIHKEDMAIIRTIITLAHDLELKVVAEGVEDQKIFDSLREIGCDEIQGYYISRPLPKSEFEKQFITPLN